MLIRNPLLALSISLIVSINLVSAQDQDQDQGAKKKKSQRRVNPAMKQITDVPGLTRILLIGDSISIGYTVATREALKGKANVHRIPTNGGPTTRGLTELDKWLGKGKWDVIHFNWGLHDLKYMDAKGKLTSIDKGKQQVAPEQYAKNLSQLVKRLKKTKAKLIFATTTPVVVGTKGRIHGDSKKYNTIALKVMKSQGVAIDDLYSFILPTLKTHQLPKNVHFNRQGSQTLGKQVADSILKELPKDRLKVAAWSAKHITTIENFDIPECVFHDSISGNIFVANVEAEPDEYWTDDKKGHLSIIGRNNTLNTKRWVDSSPAFILHSPKGMTRLGKHLYFTDNTRLIRCTLDGKNLKIVASGFTTANDLCSDGKNIWLSDNKGGKVYCFSPDGKKHTIKSPDGINGLTFHNKKMFGVSWDLHEVYQLDPSGKNEPVAFGLADHFKNLDGIEILDDGTFIISDFVGNRVCTISADRKIVTTLIEVATPADIGLNREAGILYVPEFLAGKVSAYQLQK